MSTVVTATAIDARVDFPLLPDLCHQRYFLQTEAAWTYNEQNITEQQRTGTATLKVISDVRVVKKLKTELETIFF